MKPAEMPEGQKEPTIRTAAASLAGGAPANDTAPAAEADALSSSALLRLGAALVVAGAAVIVGVLMAAVAASVGHVRAPSFPR